MVVVVGPVEALELLLAVAVAHFDDAADLDEGARQVDGALQLLEAHVRVDRRLGGAGHGRGEARDEDPGRRQGRHGGQRRTLHLAVLNVDLETRGERRYRATSFSSLDLRLRNDEILKPLFVLDSIVRVFLFFKTTEKFEFEIVL